MADIKFADKLSALCAMELSDAQGDPERIGEMIERLINSLSFTIAIAAKGDPRGTSDMLEGAQAYLFSAAASHAKMGEFMSRHGKRRA
jgi:hypothetical protein